MEIADTNVINKPEGFVRDSKWIIFPRLSFQNHLKIEKRNPMLGEELSSYRLNTVTGSGTKGIATGGISYEYTKEALGDCDAKLFKVSTPHPFPEKLALKFLDGLTEVTVIEELDPVIERELIYICGKHHLDVTIRGKLTGDVQQAGENTVESVKSVLHVSVFQLCKFLSSLLFMYDSAGHRRRGWYRHC